MSNPKEKICFVIRPFHSPYKERHNNIFKPAIEGAGLEAYLAGGPGVSEINKDIEDGIRNAHICFADVSENNANVWYEVGFAFACYKKVAMVCNTDIRDPKTLPFDVKIRNVIWYTKSVDSNVQSAAKLQKEITEHIKKLPKTNLYLAPQPPVENNTSIILDGLTRGDLKILHDIMTHYVEYEVPLLVSYLKGQHNSLDVNASIPILMEKGYIVLEYILLVEKGYKSTDKARELYRKHKKLFENGVPFAYPPPPSVVLRGVSQKSQ